MLELINKDILTVEEGIVCHQVNCKSVMGAGLALAISKKWPIVYTTYKQFIIDSGGEEKVFGENCLVDVSEKPQLLVANLFGQFDAGGKRATNYGALSKALHFLYLDLLDDELSLKVYFPYGMGCGLGGGDWNIVQELIEFHFPNGIICKKN